MGRRSTPLLRILPRCKFSSFLPPVCPVSDFLFILAVLEYRHKICVGDWQTVAVPDVGVGKLGAGEVKKVVANNVSFIYL
jgi:hypothetical protein